MIKTSDVQIGQLSKKYERFKGGNFEEYHKNKKEVSRFDVWKSSLNEKGDFISCNAVGDAYHKNYMEYLEICWSDHLGVVFTPDVLWYAILCELAEIVKENPEEFREHFSHSNEKQEITVMTDSESEMPISVLINAMRGRVPINIEDFLPSFSTSTERSLHAFQVSFADLASPYYDYSMYCCGIPLVDVRGSREDYLSLRDTLNRLGDIFAGPWYFKTLKFINELMSNLESPAFWNDIFKLEKCGSGGQVQVTGWWSQLFRKQPSVCYTYNFSTQLSSINYKNLSSGNNYKMSSGLLSSKVEGDLLVPDFGQIIYKVNPT